MWAMAVRTLPRRPRQLCGVRQLCTVREGRRGRSHWEDAANRRAFVEEMRLQFGVQQPQEWRKVTHAMVRQAGGAGLLARHGDSVLAMLQDAYPELHLSERLTRARVSQQYWEVAEHRREVLDAVAEAHGVKEAGDWARVTAADVCREHGGSSLLRRYSNSVFACLKDTYPELAASALECRAQAPQGFWRERSNRRAYLDQLAEEWGIEEPSGWKKVTAERVREARGSRLLALYGNSLHAALRDLYPEHEAVWQQAGSRQKVPAAYWQDDAHVRTFVEHVRERLGVRQPEDWARVSQEQIRRLGGRGLLERMTVQHALAMVYPDVDWQAVQPAAAKASKASQRLLAVCMARLMPWATVQEEHMHPFLGAGQGGGRDAYGLELDVFVPEANLALEYNGRHHYQEIAFFGPLQIYQERDAEKAELCRRAGVTLVTVPYWWDNSLESLAATLAAVDANLLESSGAGGGRSEEAERVVREVREGRHLPIPLSPPGGTLEMGGYTGSSGQPDGLLMAELHSGMRVHTNEEQEIATAKGKRVTTPAGWDVPGSVEGILVKE